MEKINFDNLVGSKANLYLYTGEINCFQLGSVIFRVVEDEQDGYRSSLDHVEIVNRNAPLGQFLDEIIIHENGATYSLIGTNNHEWLRFGTNNWDDYCPMFIYIWTPKDYETDDFADIKTLIKS